MSLPVLKRREIRPRCLMVEEQDLEKHEATVCHSLPAVGPSVLWLETHSPDTVPGESVLSTFLGPDHVWDSHPWFPRPVD